jgi:type I restriction enzyme, S subunit
MEWGGGEIPALSAKNVCMGKVDLSRETYFGSDALYERWMTSGDPERGDVLMTLEAPLGNIAWIPDERKYILSQRVVLLRPRPSMVDKEYLGYQLMSEHFQSALVRNSTGTTAIGIQRAKLETIPVLIPRSLDEQRRIGAAINTINEAIAKTEAVIAKLKHVRAGLLHDLLTRGIDQHAQLRDPITHPEQFQDSPLGHIPNEWHLCRLGEALQSPPRNGYSPQEGREFSGSYLLGLSCLTSEGFAPRQLKNAPTNDPQLTPFLLRDGDLLISRSNTRDRVGLAGIFRNVGYPCYYPDLMMRLTPRAELITEFLELLLHHSRSRSMLVATASGTSGSMVKITGAGVMETPIAYPDSDEQQRILTALIPFREELRTLDTEHLKLTMLKSGMMTDLLTGRVRVPESVSAVENQP